MDRSDGSARLWGWSLLGGAGIFVAVNAGVVGVWTYWEGAAAWAIVQMAVSVGGLVLYQWAAYRATRYDAER